jgi:ABC-type cobalt transport system substrate-binding protein
MRKSKLLFVVLAVVFIVILVLIAIDFSSRTTFPGHRGATNGQVDADTALAE